MNNREEKKPIKDAVLEKIKSGNAKMRPRWHFVLKTSLATFGGIILALAILYVVSFIIFILHQTGAWFAPSFGPRGIFIILASVPWVLVGATIVFAVLLEVLAKNYSFAYKTPLLYSAAAIVGLVLIGGVFVPYAGIHERMMRFTRDNEVPIARPFYEKFGMRRSADIHPGTVVENLGTRMLITDRFGESLIVNISSGTRFPLKAEFKEGDRVVIFGERKENEISAFGVREVDELWESPMTRGDMRTRLRHMK